MQGTTTVASVDVSVATPNSNGYYALTVPSGLTLGSNTLKVVYSGDSNYSSVNTYAFVTGVTSLSTTLVPSYSTLATVGQPYTISVAINGTVVTGTPRTGTLTLSEGGNTLVSVNLSSVTPTASGFYVAYGARWTIGRDSQSHGFVQRRRELLEFDRELESGRCECSFAVR